MGYNRNQSSDYKVKDFCKLISEFALEYKTVRDRLLQQKEKRNSKTKPHLITDVSFVLFLKFIDFVRVLNNLFTKSCFILFATI